jgi:HPt (histidine-containing phosphotransfer) domain-containing protein
MLKNISLPMNLHSTVSELPLHQFSLSVNSPGALAAEVFEQNPDLPGVIVYDGDEMSGMIPRKSFHERIGRSFGVEVYLRRPLQTILQSVDNAPLILNEDCAIPAAAQAALNREMEEVYAPLVIKMQDASLCLLDVYSLLLAQSRLLSATNQIAAAPSYEMQSSPKESRETHWEIKPSIINDSPDFNESMLDVSCLKNLLDMIGSQTGTPLRALANQLVEDIPMLFNDARQAILYKDAGSLEKAAHTIRITASTFGLCQLAEIGLELETIARKSFMDQSQMESQRLLDLAMEKFPSARRSLFTLIQSLYKTKI